MELANRRDTDILAVDGAISEYREAVRLNPKNDLAHFGLGNRLEENKHDSRAALEEFRIAYNLVPTNEK